MRSSQIIRLFFSTLIVGVAASLLMRYGVGELFNFHYNGGFAKYMMFGLMFSIVSQMGFFAYLMVNYFTANLRRSGYWKIIQMAIIVLVFFYLVSMRAAKFSEDNGWLPFTVLPLLLLLASFVVAYFKVKATNGGAWIPTVFFIFVFTTIEWIPGLQGNNLPSLLIMGVSLIACNTWQIMKLHQIAGNVQKKKAA